MTIQTRAITGLYTVSDAQRFLDNCKLCLYNVDYPLRLRSIEDYCFGYIPFRFDVTWVFCKSISVYGYAIKDDLGVWTYDRFSGAPFNIPSSGGTINIKLDMLDFSLDIPGCNTIRQYLRDMPLSHWSEPIIHHVWPSKQIKEISWIEDGF